jgi:hypothetical protein
MKRLTFYTKPGCCVCDEALEVVEEVGRTVKFDFDKIDVSTSDDLLERYGAFVPVIEIDGIKAFEFQVDGRELELMLTQTPNGTAGAAR